MEIRDQVIEMVREMPNPHTSHYPPYRLDELQE